MIWGFEVSLNADQAGVGRELSEESGFAEEAGGDEGMMRVEGGVFQGVLMSLLGMSDGRTLALAVKMWRTSISFAP